MYTYNPISSMQDLGIQDIQSYNLSKKKKNSLLHYALNNEKSVDIDKIKDPYAVDEEPPIIEETLGTDEDYDFIPETEDSSQLSSGNQYVPWKITEVLY